MLLVTFSENGKEKLGFVAAERTHVYPLLDCEQHYTSEQHLPATMIELISQWDASEEKVRFLQKAVQADDLCPHKIPFENIKLKAPIPRPTKNIFCIGKNYKEHALELASGNLSDAIPKHPVIFTKAPTTVIATGDIIDSHSHMTSGVDYEVELAVIIGKKAKGISREEAMDYIFGYTIMNDVTARDLQKQHMQWFRGKSMDTFGPMGPFLVHKSAVPDPGNLHIQSKVNGEIRQDANTKDFIFDIPTLLATISAGITLEPGDIIATGTPAGVGAGFHPPKFLKAGDVIECTIENLGVLRNTIS